VLSLYAEATSSAPAVLRFAGHAARCAWGPSFGVLNVSLLLRFCGRSCGDGRDGVVNIHGLHRHPHYSWRLLHRHHHLSSGSGAGGCRRLRPYYCLLQFRVSVWRGVRAAARAHFSGMRYIPSGANLSPSPASLPSSRGLLGRRGGGRLLRILPLCMPSCWPLHSAGIPTLISLLRLLGKGYLLAMFPVLLLRARACAACIPCLPHTLPLHAPRLPRTHARTTYAHAAHTACAYYSLPLPPPTCTFAMPACLWWQTIISSCWRPGAAGAGEPFSLVLHYCTHTPAPTHLHTPAPTATHILPLLHA